MLSRGLQASLLGAVALALAGLPACSAPPPSRPNVLLISIDTLRADHLSAYGYDRPTSPFLDDLSRDSARFDYAYAHSPFTLTSHMSIMTSRAPRAHGVGKEQALSEGLSSLADELRGAGYETLGIYSIDWLDPKFGFGRGFDVYEASPTSGDRLLARALELLAARTRSGPFFLFFHLRDVHTAPRMQDHGRPLYDAPEEFRDAFLPHPSLPIDYSPKEVWEQSRALSPEELDNVVARYDGGILYADSIVRQLVEELRRQDLFEDTLLIVTSDHGEFLGDHGMIAGHGGLFETGLRVPLIIKLPDSHTLRDRWRGVVFGRRVQHLDLAPTVLEVAGLPTPDTFRGRSLFDPTPREVIASYNEWDALLRGRHKVLRVEVEGKRPAWQLYDLEADPSEQQSVFAQHPEFGEGLAHDLDRQLEAQRLDLEVIAGEGTAVQLDEDKRAALRALGYAE